MPSINILEVLRSSFTLGILIVCSVISLTFAFERWWFYRSIRVNAAAFMDRLRELIEAGKIEEAAKLCSSHPSPLAAVMRVAVGGKGRSKNDILSLLNAAQIDEKLKLERFLGILGTMGNIAPFIGLFGTVIGIIKAFHDLAMSGSAGPSVVAAGIAEALVATAGGLAVAIPSVIFYNYFMKKTKDIVAEMDAAIIRVLVYLKAA